MPTKSKTAPRRTSSLRRPATAAVMEKQIPGRARTALVAAARRAKAKRLNTMEVVNGTLVLVSPDGERTVVKSVEPGITVKIGLKISLR